LLTVAARTAQASVRAARARKGPIQIVGKAGSTVTLDAEACDPGLREWFASLAQ
jgi:hypothetical protein